MGKHNKTIVKYTINNPEVLRKLVVNVSFEFQKYLNGLINNYFDTSQKRVNHLYGLTKLLTMIINKKNLDIDMIQKAVEYHNHLNLTKEQMKEALDKLTGLLVKFLKKKNIKFDMNNIEKFQEIFMEEFTNDFFEIDTEDIDTNIEQMHYEEHKKISAKEFMQEGSIEEGIIHELEELLDEYYHISFDELNEAYLEKFKSIIEEFIKVFNYSFEFKDLAYGLQNLLNVLNNINIKENKELIRLLLDSIMEDLNKFYQSVFVKQDAIDIHYLDASLLANISQIEIILNQTKGE